VPSLTVLRLSESFAALWQEIATDAKLSLDITSDPTRASGARDAVILIAAGGEEDRIDETLRAIAVANGEIGVVGALASHRLAVSAMRGGAAEYFALPADAELLRSWVRERADRLRSLHNRSAFAASERAKYAFDGILGTSAPLRETLERASRIIPHATVTVLITGETGTGKELLARAIHYNGPRREAPFVDINCAAIPEQLLESELFGHEKGAFTDARSAKPGLFEMANGGTLFLDEIGHLALTLQGKLLRALEERQVRRVGGTRSTPIDVRVVAATHIDLAAAVRSGRFREDLFYRLNVVPLELPPLRARRDDIGPLAHHFLARFAREYGLAPPSLTAAAERALRMHVWSGNIRELRNVLERAVLLADGPTIDTTDLALGEASTQRSDSGLPFPATLASITRAAVDEMLKLCEGNKSDAARRLGISRPRLQRLLDNEPDTDSDPGDTDA
jgi:DNA-binding NtrC family response regulator